MNKSDQFSIVLPSNSSLDIFKDNTTSAFTVKLPGEVRLSGLWEVGLAEIHFPHTFLHLTEKNAQLTVEDWIVQSVTLSFTKLKIAHGLYANSMDFLNKVNEEFSKANIVFEMCPDKTPFLNVKSTCDKVHKSECVHTIINSRGLLKMLGFENETGSLRISKKPATADRPLHILNNTPRQLFVYTDISEPVVVGNSKTTLIRIVPVNLKNYTFGSSQYQTFAPIKYVPLKTDNFATISIDIRDEFGERIPFEFGTLIVTLHFRKRTES